MMTFAKTYLAAIVSLGILDFVWLGFVVKQFNNDQLASIAYMQDGQTTPMKIPALLVYLIMALALTIFAAPKVDDGTLLTSLAWGAVLGFSIYAVYDLTNYALIKGYPLPFALVDMFWGTVLFALANAALFLGRDWIRS